MNHTLTKVLDRVYLLKFEQHYDLCMLFLRCQEFYESTNPRFYRSKFNLLDYMEWQAKTQGDGIFDYPNRWAGFNLPSQIIDEVFALGIDDYNRYDEQMWDLNLRLKQEVGSSGNYYLIGVSNDETIDHEVAHGLYTTNSAYHQEMNNLIDALPTKTYAKMAKWLTSIDYAESSHRDEIQAYLATGFPNSSKIKCKSVSKPFIKTLQCYIEAYAQGKENQEN